MALGDIRVNDNVPEWIGDYVQHLRDRLLLNHWEVNVQIERVIQNDPAIEGLCHVESRYNRATVTVRSDCEDTAYWRSVIRHEMIELTMAHMTSFVEERIACDFDEMQSRLILNTYNDYKERCIETLVSAFHEQEVSP
jgi:hypothetical protein